MLHEIFHFFGRAICHQLEERSLLVSGGPLAVCARDTGIYIGVFSTFIYLHFTKRSQSITIPSIKLSFLLLLMLVPLILDGLGSYSNLFESNNLRRLVTGISFGLVLPYFIYPLLSKRSLLHGSKSVISNRMDFLAPLLVSVLIGGLFYLGQPSHYVLDSFITFSIIGWFSLIASFLFQFIQSERIKSVLSITASLTFLTFLSFAHKWILYLSSISIE
ncbi:DUF2085 domain-containing protein [Neobacillus vireti]|uniref:DUF2085 domain-containing protein n=1 Tax=Neobacillus vireti TaxID=220686 RepID=UPI003000759D